MFFEIKGTLLEKTVEVANKLAITVAKLAEYAYNRGLAELEKSPVSAREANIDTRNTLPHTDDETAIQSTDVFIKKYWQSMSDREIALKLGLATHMVSFKRRGLGLLKPKGGCRKIDGEAEKFIRKNYETMNDVEIAEKFSCCASTILKKRLALRLLRPRRVPAKYHHGIGHTAPSSLTEEQKTFVRENATEMNNHQLAEHLKTSVGEIFRAKNEIREKFIRENWEKMTDGEMGRALGIKSPVYIARVRVLIGLTRNKGGGKNRKIMSPIDREELLRAVTVEGLNLIEFVRKKKLNITRERMRQIANELGVKQERTPLWWANRYGIPQCADKAWLEARVAEKYTASAVAAMLGSTEERVRKMCRLHGIAPRRSTPMVELICSTCETKFIRKRNLVRNPNQTTFFCGQKCKGIYAGKHYGGGKGKHRSKKV